MRKVHTVRFATALIFLTALSAHALTIVPNYDASVTNQASAAIIENAFATAAQIFQNTYSDPITINLNVYWGAAGPFPTNPNGAESDDAYLTNLNYTAARAALTNDAKSANDFKFNGNLPAADPGPNASFTIVTSEAKALGLNFSYNNALFEGALTTFSNADGAVSFDSNTNNWFFNHASPVSNKFDFVAAAEHEISEVMGRMTFLKLNEDAPFDYSRFTGPGARSFTTNTAGVYFSIDNGTNNLMNFNGIAGADFQDWGTNSPPDAFSAFGSNGIAVAFSAVDVTALDVIGYDLTVPEPSTLLLLGTGLGLLGLAARRKRRT